jgi:predicted  nucleic acid-binding Zn-ribbon protein
LRDEIRELTRRVDLLEQRIGGLEERVGDLEERVGGLEERMGGLEHQVRSLRDWATREFADLRLETRRLREAVQESDEARRQLNVLDERVTRLERRLADG